MHIRRTHGLRRGLRLPAAILIAAALVGTGPIPTQAAQASGGRTDWPSWTKDLNGTRHNAAEWKINPRTAGQLKLKWAYTYAAIPYARTGSQPAVVDGVLYVGAPDAKFLALDAKTGATKWTFDLTAVAGPSPVDNPNMVRNGASVSGGAVHFGDSRGYVYSVDTATGKLRWATRVDDHPSTWMTGSPVVHEGRVYTGISSIEAGFASDPNYACCTSRGAVVALDGRTGRQVWRYHTMPESKEVGTWPSGAKKFSPSGGAVWATPVIDRRTRTLFVGTGQNYTGQAGDIDSVLALSIDTGRPRWKRQMTFPDTYTQQCSEPDPGDYCPSRADGTALDFDFGASANLFTVGGRTVVGVGQKGGVYYAFDAVTGATVWQTRLATPDISDADPGAAGIEWGSSYDGRYIYVATWRPDPPTLFALNPADGSVVWRKEHPADGCQTGGAAQHPEFCWLGFTPAVTTTPGLVYEGSADGKMRIFSARDGRVLWEFDTVRDFDGVNGLPGRGRAVSGNGGAVIVNGMLYVQSGYYPFYPSDKGHVLLAFGL